MATSNKKPSQSSPTPFQQIFQTKEHGDSVMSLDPMQDALIQTAYLRVCGYKPFLKGDSKRFVTVTVKDDIVAPLTFIFEEVS